MRKICFLIVLFQIPALLWAMGSSPRPTTILLVPSVHSVVQIGRDFVDRENVLLMAYAPKTSPDAMHLHAWTGSDWVRISPEAFAKGSFLRQPPAKVLVVGAPNPLTTRLIETSAAWSPEVLNLESTNITELVNSLGRLFAFRQSDWAWFAKRYELKLEDLNAMMPKKSWYDSNRASDLPPPTNPLQRDSDAENPKQVPHPVLMPEPLPTEVPANPSPASAAPALETEAREAFSFESK